MTRIAPDFRSASPGVPVRRRARMCWSRIPPTGHSFSP